MWRPERSVKLWRAAVPSPYCASLPSETTAPRETWMRSSASATTSPAPTKLVEPLIVSVVGSIVTEPRFEPAFALARNVAAVERDFVLRGELRLAAVAALRAARDVDDGAVVHRRAAFGVRVDVAAGALAFAAGRGGDAARFELEIARRVELHLAVLLAHGVGLHDAALAHHLGAHLREAAVGDELAEVHGFAARLRPARCTSRRGRFRSGRR